MQQERLEDGTPSRPRPASITPLVAGVIALAAITFIEMRWPLRRRRESQAQRFARNAALAATTAIALGLTQRPLLQPVLERTKRRRSGLLNQMSLPAGVRTAAGVLLLDYTLWWWHWLNHRLPLLWRFHLVHHIDRDMDASTALRFHFGEMTLSILFRALQVRVLGVDERTLTIWNSLLMPSILFHHSNTRLPRRIDRALTKLFVTPRMHGIHHSTVREQTDSNWSSLVSWWDWLHGTLLLDVPQETIVVGVPAYQLPSDVTIGKCLAIPFVMQRDDWNAEG